MRSSSSAKYVVQRKRNKFAERAFSVAGPSVWNSLPADLRLEPDTAAVLNTSCFVLFLLRNFLRFNVTIVIRYSTLFHIVISVQYTKRLSCNALKCDLGSASRLKLSKRVRTEHCCEIHFGEKTTHSVI